MKRSILIGLGCAAALAACITINVYFPEAAVKELSQQIEDEVQRKAADEPSPAARTDADTGRSVRGGHVREPALVHLLPRRDHCVCGRGPGRGARNHQPGDP